MYLLRGHRLRLPHPPGSLLLLPVILLVAADLVTHVAHSCALRAHVDSKRHSICMRFRYRAEVDH